MSSFEDNVKQSFWNWLAFGSGGEPGYTRVVDWYLFAHLAVAVLVSLLVEKSLADAASTCLLPSMSILVGLTFAWIGNAQGLLQSKATRLLGEQHPGGHLEYVFTYQLAVFVMLGSICVLALASLAPLASHRFVIRGSVLHFIFEVFFYFVISVAIGMAWKTVNGTHYLLRANVVLDEAIEQLEKAKRGE